MIRSDFCSRFIRAAVIVAAFFGCAAQALAEVPVITTAKATPREQYGAARLRAALAKVNAPANAQVLVAERSSALLSKYKLPEFWPGAAEAFLLRRIGNTWIVAGSDASGALYGSLELASRIHASGTLPAELDFMDHPQLKLRGPCIGMQRPEVTYEGGVYDYRYTQEEFPFFYDKAGWTRYLDMLVNNRMNTLYLWNGHPFTSILKLPRYPEAKELTDEQIDRNIAMYRWLTEEADRRGIWVVQGFYNIHVSHTFAKAHGIPFQLHEPNPLVTEYTRYSISEFIRSYPNVGLLITLGEALRYDRGAEWMTQAIIPGVKDGMRALGITKEPPIVVRAHATEIDDVMAKSLPLYHNLETMEKWNGESLTWFNVRGEIRQKAQRLSEIAQVNITNVHLLSNLEPFRWGDPDFIRKTVLNFQRIGIGGLHLYPLRYWEWPYSADNTQPRLQQTERDWIWFDAWGRYAWNPNRDSDAEQRYWAERIGARYGSREAGERLLAAYKYSGICAPKLLPRIGITEGNREAFALGLLMPQLIHPTRYSAAKDLWLGDAPEGERLADYVEKEVKHQSHEGETPLGVAAEVVASSAQAVKAAEEAGPHVTSNREEYERLLNDMRSIHTLMTYYNQKTQAAALVLRYGYDHDTTHLAEAEKLLAASVESFRHLVVLTDKTYRQACSIHMGQRQIPFPGAPGKYTHWRDCLPEYEKELATFRERLRWLQSANGSSTGAPLQQIPFHLEGGKGEVFSLQAGAKLYTDVDVSVVDLAPQLSGLSGIRIAQQPGWTGATELQVALDKPAKVLVGFFKRSSKKFHPATPPSGWTLEMMNAVTATGHPTFAVWSQALPSGKSTLKLGKGPYVVLGFVAEDAPVGPRMNFSATSTSTQEPDMDWFFE